MYQDEIISQHGTVALCRGGECTPRSL